MYKENQARGGVVGSASLQGPSHSPSISRINDDALSIKSATPSNYSSGYGTNQPVMQEADAKSRILHEQMMNNQDMLISEQKIFLDVNNKGNTIGNYNYTTMTRYPSNSIQNVNPLNSENNNRSNLGSNYSYANFPNMNLNFVPSNVMHSQSNTSPNSGRRSLQHHSVHSMSSLVNMNSNKLDNTEPLNFSNDSFNKNMSCSNLSSVKSDGNDEKRNLSSGALKNGADGNSHIFQGMLQGKHQSDMQGALPENHKAQPSYVNSSTGGGGAINNPLSSNNNNLSNGSARYEDPGSLSPLQQTHMHMKDPPNNYIHSANERDQNSRATTVGPQGSNAQGFSQPSQSNQSSQPMQANQPSLSSQPGQSNQQNMNLNNMNGQTTVKYHSANLPSRKQGGGVNSYVNQMNFILQVLNQLNANSKGSTSPNGNHQGAGNPSIEQSPPNQPSMTQPSVTAPIFGHASSSVASPNGNRSQNVSPYHSPNMKGKNVKPTFSDSNVNNLNMINMSTKGNLPKNMIQKIGPKSMFPSQDLIQQKLLQQKQELLQQELFQKAYNEKENQTSPSKGAFQEMHKQQCPPDNLMPNEQVRQQKLLQKIQQEQIQKQLQQLHSQQQFQVHHMQQQVQSHKVPSPLKAQQVKQHLHPQQMSPQHITTQHINAQHITAQQLHPQQLQQIQMQKLQYQQQELKKHMEQLQQKIPLPQQKFHQVYNMKQNVLLSEENEKKKKQRQISLPLNSRVPNMHNLQQLNKGEEPPLKENLNSSMGGSVSGSVSGSMSGAMGNMGGSNMGTNLSESAMYMINRKMSNNLNKLNNADHYFTYDAFQQSMSQSKIDVKDMRTHDGKNINEHNMLLNSAQARDMCSNNMPPRVVPNSIPPYISSNSPFKINHHNKNNMNNNQQQ